MPYRQRFRLPAVLFLAAFVLFAWGLTACSSGDDPVAADPPVQILTAEEFQEQIVDPQEARDVVLGELLGAGMDTTAAMDSVLVLFLADPNVVDGEVGEQGIAVTYTNGVRGGIFIDPLDDPDVPADLEGGLPNLEEIARQSASPAAEDSLRIIFLNPSYHERAKYADPIMANYNTLLENSGYKALEVYLDEEVTLDRYASLGGHRIVHVYSHGIAWPKPGNIEEVYLLSGETYSADTYRRYWDDLQRKDVLCVTLRGGKTAFLVGPMFIARHNDLANDTLFYGGFCFSGLGTWPLTLVDGLGIGGYVGFDWSVLTAYNAAWNRQLMSTMLGDKRVPYAIMNDWLTNGSQKAYLYKGRIVHVGYTGKQTLTVYDEDAVPCSATEVDHPDGYVHATVAVYLQGNPVDEAPVRVTYRKVYCDGHTNGIAPIDGETGPDGHFSAPTIGIFKLGNAQDVIEVKAVVYGVEKVKLFPYSTFSGMDGGSIFFPNRAEFVFHF